VGWEIDVDEDTMSKYLSLGDQSILSAVVDGCIGMTEEGRCPFLRDDGLCRLIAEHGEQMTSIICREHPRFYHRIGDRVEMGIGASCEEACRLILESDFRSFDSREAEIDLSCDTDFDTLSHRERIYAWLSENDDYSGKLERIASEYRLDGSIFEPDSWKDAFSELELLDESYRWLLSVGRTDQRSENHPLYIRFFAYLLLRHLSTAASLDELRARLGFCILLTRMLEDGACGGEDIYSLARLISEEIEYSEDNTAALIFEIECRL
jgi:lysine-N-methylase